MRLLSRFFKKKLTREQEYKNRAIYDSSVSFGWAGIITNFAHNPKAIIIGKNTVINGELIINPYGGKIIIGDFCYIGHNTRIQSDTQISIGNDVQISYNVSIIDNNAHELNCMERKTSLRKILVEGYENLKQRGNVLGKHIIIEDEVWINFNCIILKGVKIGRGAIIGAGSVVTKDIPPYTLAVGNPAKVIKTIN